MNTIKRIFVGIIIIIIILCAVFYSYSAIENGAVVFATNQDGTLSNDELDVAISSFLQSHGGNIFSPQNYRARKTYEAGLIHNFIYGDGGGYDSVRQHINGGVGGNNELRFDFDGFIIHKLNTWLNRKLQNGEFGEGAELNEDGMFNEGTDNILYSGKYFVDAEGNACLVFYGTQRSSGGYKYREPDKYGTEYKYTNEDIINLVGNSNYTLVFNTTSGVTRNKIIYYHAGSYNSYAYNTSSTSISSGDQLRKLSYNRNNVITYDVKGYPVVWYFSDEDKYYLGFYSNVTINGGDTSPTYVNQYISGHWYEINKSEADLINTDINFYTNNNNNISVYPTINEGDTLYITPKVNIGVDGEVNYQPYVINEGDTINNVINQYYIDSNTPDKTISYPSDNPDDNGGGDTDNPSGGNPPDWSNNYPHLSPDGEGGFNFNFTLPDLNIDWNISGLSEKFPFSIPFDLLAFCRILDAEPETPRFEGDLVLPMLTYHIDLNLERFDTIAQLLRNLEFIGFCIGLILITRSMIKG